MNVLEIHKEAMQAAIDAGKSYFDEHGEPMYCGFAWVEIRDCNKSPQKEYVTKLYNIGEAQKIGHKPGYSVSTSMVLTRGNIGWTYGQSMDIKEEAASAYAKYLRDNHGINAVMCSRAD